VLKKRWEKASEPKLFPAIFRDGLTGRL